MRSVLDHVKPDSNWNTTTLEHKGNNRSIVFGALLRRDPRMAEHIFPAVLFRDHIVARLRRLPPVGIVRHFVPASLRGTSLPMLRHSFIVPSGWRLKMAIQLPGSLTGSPVAGLVTVKV